MTAAVSADSRQMAAVTMGDRRTALCQQSGLYRLGREERYAECLLPENAVVYDLAQWAALLRRDGDGIAVCDHRRQAGRELQL